MQAFDYIIVGAGGAGLSLLMRILDEPDLVQKKILLIDKTPKKGNDRTWCFWEKGTGYFEHLVHRSWDRLLVKHPKGEIDLPMNGYSYKMLRSSDFYRHCFERIKLAGQQVQLVYGNVTGIDCTEGKVTVDGLTYTGSIVFSSVLTQAPNLSPKHWYLLQHFRGWWIETASDVFDPGQANLMNFRVPQNHGCTFMYVLPLSKRKALVEYTLFSANELTSEQYDEGLTSFIEKELGLKDYHIKEVENGVIPMTNYPFAAREGKVVFLGTAGGQTKASTGYTFSNMQKHSARVVQGLLHGNPKLFIHAAPARFSLYDRILLRVLYEQKIPGADIFFRLFKRNPASRIFRFLDNESNLGDEFAIVMSAHRRVFSLAAIREII